MSGRFKITRFARKDIKNLLGYFNFVDTVNGLEYRDFRLSKGSQGVFAASPFRTYRVEGEDKDRFSDYVRPAYENDERDELGVEFFAELTEAAEAAYEAAEAPASSGKGKSSGRGQKATAGAKKSGRGPVRNSAPDDEDDDLPF